jgi:ribosomal protein S27AE
MTYVNVLDTLYELRSDTLGLLQKYCPVCGMDVDKGTATKRFGKYFCSEKHLDYYVPSWLLLVQTPNYDWGLYS